MSDTNDMAPKLSAEDRRRIERGMAEMDRRQRENDYRDPPGNPDKLTSMAPGMTVERRKGGQVPPVDSEKETTDD